MPNNPRILNLTTGHYISRKQAVRGVVECARTWVTPGETIRNCSLAESIILRNQQAREREPLESPELPGLSFEPPRTAATSSADRRNLIQAAKEFVASVA